MDQHYDNETMKRIYPRCSGCINGGSAMKWKENIRKKIKNFGTKEMVFYIEYGMIKAVEKSTALLLP